MSQDFFLLNRAHQLNRLCLSSAINLPESKNKNKLPPALCELYDRIERIRKLTDSVYQTEDAKLNELQRADLRHFEKQIVECRFSSDDQIKTPAVAIIRAVFADATYFSGLKPLPQYTDAFAYELLFPTWLNLLTALMLPNADTGKPKLDSKQQGALFHYLGKLTGVAPNIENWLTGFATFVASRFDSPRCEQLLQRLVDLLADHADQVIGSIDSFEKSARNARELKTRLSSYLCVKHSSYQWPSSSEHRIAHARPKIRVLPAGILNQLAALELKGDQWEAYFEMALPLSRLVLSDQVLNEEYALLLVRYPSRTAELLALLVQSDGKTVLSETSQRCVALLVGKLMERNPQLKLSEVASFLQTMASRLTGYSDSTLDFFYRRFVDEPVNCDVLLSCCSCDAEETRCTWLQQLTDGVLVAVAQSNDDKRLLNLLCCATIFSNREEDREAKYALQALEGVLGNRSIGNKELEDLVKDLRQNASCALQYLARPIKAGSGKSPRLASLYLTLNDVMETFRSTGTIGNFSVVRARYSAITNLNG